MAFVLEDAARAMLYTIRDKAQDVFSTLQRGYPESVYQRALGIEFQKQNIRHDMEVTMSITYKMFNITKFINKSSNIIFSLYFMVIYYNNIFTNTS
jgi:GxxExxY protein